MLTLDHLSFEVEGKKIINDISYTFETGSFTLITGPNGGGKSTLARLIMGLEKPTDGRILWNGKDISDLSIAKRAQLKIGYAFQQPPRFKGMKVKELLQLAHGKPLTHDACCEYLSAVGLCANDYLEREVDTSLSGGEVKRIEIATLLARDLELAIFDEPEAGIDLWSFARLVETFQRLHQNKNLTILLISHQERIMQIAEQIVVIEQGRMQREGKKEDILPTLMSEFLSCDCRK